MIGHHPEDDAIEGAWIRARHVRSDVEAAAEAFYRPLTAVELEDIVRFLEGELIVDAGDLIDARNVFLDANEILTLFAFFSH